MGRIVDIIVSRDGRVHAVIIDFGGLIGIIRAPKLEKTRVSPLAVPVGMGILQCYCLTVY
jgi:hypothetical protein